MSWIPDEIDYAGQEHLDADYVAGYDAKAQVDPTEDVEILKSHGLGPGSTIVDLGAGTGVFTAAAAATGATVIAVDVSPPMAGHLRDRFAGRRQRDGRRGGLPLLRPRRNPGRFRLLPQRAASAARLLEGDRPVPHRRHAEARRNLPGARPGVRLRTLRADEFIPAWMAGGVDDPKRGWTPAELAEHVRLEFSTYRWLFEPMLERTGFEILEVDYVRRAYGAYTCRRQSTTVTLGGREPTR